MRQEDLGRSAGVSQDLVSLIERGKIDGLRIRILVELARNLGADLVVTLRWRGGDLDRLLDEGHAALMARAAAILESAGWSVMPEVTFAHFADRGSIDILAWHHRPQPSSSSRSRPSSHPSRKHSAPIT